MGKTIQWTFAITAMIALAVAVVAIFFHNSSDVLEWCALGALARYMMS